MAEHRTPGAGTKPAPGPRRPPHLYTPDTSIPADYRDQHPCLCGRAKANAVHDHAAVAQLVAGQAEHRRRTGEREDT